MVVALPVHWPCKLDYRVSAFSRHVHRAHRYGFRLLDDGRRVGRRSTWRRSVTPVSELRALNSHRRGGGVRGAEFVNCRLSESYLLTALGNAECGRSGIGEEWGCGCELAQGLKFMCFIYTNFRVLCNSDRSSRMLAGRLVVSRYSFCRLEETS
jgi:hypothetical protein